MAKLAQLCFNSAESVLDYGQPTIANIYLLNFQYIKYHNWHSDYTKGSCSRPLNHAEVSYVYTMGILYRQILNMVYKTAGQLELTLPVNETSVKVLS